MKHGTKLFIFRLPIIFMLLWLFASMAYANEISDIHTIKLVQAALNSEGYSCGTVDGIAGKKTQSAIEEFKQDQNLNIDGYVTEELVTALQITDEMLKGEVYNDFTYRYNESVAFLNDISSQTGDPTIQEISEEKLKKGISKLDEVTSFNVDTDERKISITGLGIARETNEYDIPMVYELVSSTYAMDDSFTSVDDTIAFVGTFIENKSAATEKMSYGIWNHEGIIYFTVTAR